MADFVVVYTLVTQYFFSLLNFDNFQFITFLSLFNVLMFIVKAEDKAI